MRHFFAIVALAAAVAISAGAAYAESQNGGADHGIASPSNEIAVDQQGDNPAVVSGPAEPAVPPLLQYRLDNMGK